MRRRELFRRSIFGIIGTALSSVLPGRFVEASKFHAPYDVAQELSSPNWKPVFLKPHQNDTLIRLSDLIIPETDTLGAKAALANRFIDRLLGIETSDSQRDFLNALDYLDENCLERYDKTFVHLPEASQIEFLTLIAHPATLLNWWNNRDPNRGHEHFKILKNWVSRAYYSSEIGQRELGWEGAPPLGTFEGCLHSKDTHK